MSQQTPIIIPAAIGNNPGIIRQNISGKFYAVIDATGVFKIRVGNGSEIESKIGHYLGDDNSPEFGSISFYNYTAVPITVTYYAGMVFYKPTTSTNTTLTNPAITVTGKNAPTYTKGTAGGAGVFSGFDGANPRKSFSVFNNEAAGSGNDVRVRGANGVDGHIVKPQTGYVVESGSVITLLGAFDFYVVEVFYSP